MTTFPKHPAVKAPAVIADNARQATRAHARLDSVESVQSKQTSDITTANTNITTGATNLTALNTRLGGNGQETFLGTLGSMSTLAHLSAANSAVVMPGTYNQGAAQTAINSAVDDVTNLIINKMNSLIDELRSSNYMT